MKPWFRLTNKPSIEYSTDINFFLKEQITVWKSGNRYDYCSRLESKLFLHEEATAAQNYEFTDDHTKDMCMKIHREILEGKHGEGIFVD
jgi:hypothetical protein